MKIIMIPRPIAYIILCFGMGSVLAGCSGTSTAPDAKPSTGEKKSTATDSKSTAATSRPKVDMDAMNAAKLLTRDTAMQIGFMTSDADFDRSITGIDNAHKKIDIEAAFKGLELLATLPDNTDNEFVPVLSKSIPPIQECFELYKSSLTSKKPFSDGSGNGEKMAKLAGDNHLLLDVAVAGSLEKVDPK